MLGVVGNWQSGDGVYKSYKHDVNYGTANEQIPNTKTVVVVVQIIDQIADHLICTICQQRPLFFL